MAKAPADGYTLLLSNTAPISISPFMLDKSPYDPIKSFTHIAYIGSVPNVFVVNPSVPAKTMQELVAFAKANPGTGSYEIRPVAEMYESHLPVEKKPAA